VVGRDEFLYLNKALVLEEVRVLVVEDVELDFLSIRVRVLAARDDRVDFFSGHAVEVEFAIPRDLRAVFLGEGGDCCVDVRDAREFIAVRGDEDRVVPEPVNATAFAVEFRLGEEELSEFGELGGGDRVSEHDAFALGEWT